ncbi:transposase family protein [Deinococcus oregonensis]|uniref:Transposase family protein n=1 Tax=Deinococcus oregonensis TaxID=1805970 RepID=A0ABV6AWT3_9DEIO
MVTPGFDRRKLRCRLLRPRKSVAPDLEGLGPARLCWTTFGGRTCHRLIGPSGSAERSVPDSAQHLNLPQPLWRTHGHAITSHKATRASPLSAEQHPENRVLAHTRQGTLHVIRRMKVFRVMKGTYRHRRRRFALRVHLIAALCNLTRTCPS